MDWILLILLGIASGALGGTLVLIWQAACRFVGRRRHQSATSGRLLELRPSKEVSASVRQPWTPTNGATSSERTRGRSSGPTKS